MKITVAKSDRAFAVIVALIAVTVLTMMAGMFAIAMKTETRLAANTNNDEEFYWIGRGGIERACWWLALEGKQPYSSKQQYWAGGPGDGPETNSPLASESLSGYQIGGGTVSLTMVEQESKININTADGNLIQHVLTAQGADASAITVVSDSVLDWVDNDDATRPAGAESDYYVGLTPSYNAKNAPIDNLDELELIKGVTRDMYTGGSSTAAGAAFPHHQLGFGHAPGQEPIYAFGLKDVFTPYSNGKINLLTADDNVLQLIPGIDTAAAQAIETARDSEPPARSLGQLMQAAGIEDPQAASQMANYITVQGSTYEVHARVTIGQISHEYTAILSRGPGGGIEVYNFYRSDSSSN